MLRPRRFRRLLPAVVALALPLVAAPVASAAGARAPAVAVSASRPGVAAFGRWVPVTVTVRNPGGRALAGATLTVAPPRGVQARVAGTRRRSATLPAIPAGGSVRVTVRLSASADAAADAMASVRVRAGRRAGSTRVALRLPTLAGRWYWTVQFDGSLNLVARGVYFVDGRWAYRGMAKGGLPGCAARTADGPEGEGCVPYAYDPRTNAVTVDGVAGRLEAPGLRLGDDSYEPFAVPARGARFAGGGTHGTQVGLCPGAYCTITIADLRFTADGRFARGAAIAGSAGDVDFGALAPEQHGTYEVDAPGRVRLTFVDGRVETRTLGFLTRDDGSADPAKGIALDEKIYIESD